MSSDRSRPARLGPLAVVAALVALVAGYLNDCFAGLGLAPAPGGKIDTAREVVQEKVKQTAEAVKAVPVVVQGEKCRVGDTPLRACEEVCGEQAAGAQIEVVAAEGTHRTVEALRECLKGRGVKVKLNSE
jgi:hypothetical protein